MSIGPAVAGQHQAPAFDAAFAALIDHVAQLLAVEYVALMEAAADKELDGEVSG